MLLQHQFLQAGGAGTSYSLQEKIRRSVSSGSDTQVVDAQFNLVQDKMEGTQLKG